MMGTAAPRSRPDVLRARLQKVWGMVRSLEACARNARRTGNAEWADRFARAAEAIEELAAELEMALDETAPGANR